ncbi:MAG: hypothetical protein ABF449_08415 [Ethanoligenens sp.]
MLALLVVLDVEDIVGALEADLVETEETVPILKVPVAAVAVLPQLPITTDVIIAAARAHPPTAV